jgi:GNAT superfamily N-acetyltransferase
MAIDWDLRTIESPPTTGLPTADGARETAESLASDLDRGAWLAVARDRHRDITGSVRAFAEPSGAWVVRRLAVLPHFRGSGLAQALMRHLEEAAASKGVTIVRLDAVVERGNPPFYASLGYTTTAHFPGPGKPLSEVAMHREVRRPAMRFRYPWEGESAPGRYRLLVTWHTDGEKTVARHHCDVESALRVASEPFDGLTFAGADGCQDCDVRDIVRDGVFAGPPAAVPAYRMPRTVHPDLLALWRLRAR